VLAQQLTQLRFIVYDENLERFRRRIAPWHSHC